MIGLDGVARGAVGSLLGTPPVRLARFIVSTAKPGAYADDVFANHAQRRRAQDAATVQVLTDMALWASTNGTPDFAEETRHLLHEFTARAEVSLADALDPHRATVAQTLLGLSAS